MMSLDNVFTACYVYLIEKSCWI